MKHFFTLIITLSAVTQVYTQNYIDVAKLSLNTTPENKFASSSSKTRVNEQNLDVTIPVKLNSSTNFITGLTNELINTKLYANESMKVFGSVGVKLGVNKTINDKWSNTTVFLPKMASDFKINSRNDFQMGMMTLFKFKKHEGLNYKFGIYYNNELSGPFVVPMFGFYYLSENKRFETNVILPLMADFNYKLTERFYVGCNFNGQLRSYHLNDKVMDKANTYVSKSSNELFIYLRTNLTKNILLYTRMGQSFARSYKVYSVSDKVEASLPAYNINDKRTVNNTTFSNGLVFQISVSYRIHLN